MIAAFSRGFLPKLALFRLCFGLTYDFRASNPRYESPLLQSRITYRKVARYLYIKTLSSIRVYTDGRTTCIGLRGPPRDTGVFSHPSIEVSMVLAPPVD